MFYFIYKFPNFNGSIQLNSIWAPFNMNTTECIEMHQLIFVYVNIDKSPCTRRLDIQGNQFSHVIKIFIRWPVHLTIFIGQW